MSTVVCFSNDTHDRSVTEEQDMTEVTNGSHPQEAAARWTTRQVMAACLWAALFGLACGYGWSFFHFARALV